MAQHRGTLRKWLNSRRIQSYFMRGETQNGRISTTAFGGLFRCVVILLVGGDISTKSASASAYRDNSAQFLLRYGGQAPQDRDLGAIRLS